MMLCEEAMRLVQDALNKGREMRRQQKRYFATRTPAALVYARHGDFRRLTYWTAAAVLTATVTY